jgi:hypothetical protein
VFRRIAAAVAALAATVAIAAPVVQHDDDAKAKSTVAFVDRSSWS